MSFYTDVIVKDPRFIAGGVDTGFLAGLAQ